MAGPPAHLHSSKRKEISPRLVMSASKSTAQKMLVAINLQ
jgi:hypothetical protein